MLSNLISIYLISNQLSDVTEFIGHLKNLTKLYLWGNQLSALPEFIGQLTNLTELNLDSNQLSEVPEFLDKLTALTTLSLCDNQLSEVTEFLNKLPTNLTKLDLSINQLSEIPDFLSKLVNLTRLDLYDNQLSEVPKFMDQLTNLTELNLGGNQLSGIPEFLSKLTNLTKLYLHNNQFSAVPEFIGQLTNLTELSLSGNQLSDVPKSIGQLTNLTELYLHNNQLSKVPDFINDLTNLTTLNLWGNRISELPKCIQSLTNLQKLDVRANQLPISPELLGSRRRSESPTAPTDLFRLYFQQSSKLKSAPLSEAKLLIVGEGETGKTTLAKKLLDPDYELDSQEKSTEGIEVSNYKFQHTSNCDCRVNVWDFGGQEIYHATHQFFLTERSVYALVVDSRRENPNFYFWLNVIRLHGGDHSPILIIKNEKQDRPCNVNDLQLRSQFKTLKDGIETNLKSNRGLDNVKSVIEQYISNLPGLGSNFPEAWSQIRNALENRTLGKEYYIDINEYRKICRRYGVNDRSEQNSLGRTLHNLGIFLHFQDILALEKTLFLKPAWCTAAVYKVLDTDTVRQDCGRFCKDDLDKIWSDDQYADVRGELLALMKEFEVCYEINGYKDHFIAPHLLASNLPEADQYTWDDQNNLILTYRYTFKPKNIFPRFIVALHKYIERQKVVWKHGVVLSILSARAEVIEEVGYERSCIHIRVSGTDKKRLLSVIRHELDRIHDSFERLETEVLVPCNCSECKGNQTPYTFPYQTLLKSIEKRNYKLQCLYSFEQVNVRRLIDDVFEADREFEPKRDPESKGRKAHPDDFTEKYSSEPEIESPFNNKFNITVNLPEQRYEKSDTINVKGDVQNSQLSVGNDNTLNQSISQLDPDSLSLTQDLRALLEDLSQDFRSDTERGQTKIKDAVLAEIQQKPTLKARTLKAFKAASEQTLIEALDHPVAKVTIKAIKGFLEG